MRLLKTGICWLAFWFKPVLYSPQTIVGENTRDSSLKSFWIDSKTKTWYSTAIVIYHPENLVLNGFRHNSKTFEDITVHFEVISNLFKDLNSILHALLNKRSLLFNAKKIIKAFS